MTGISGLLELYHVHGMEDAGGGGGVSTGNVPPHLGFAHLGFTVPDVLAAVQRLREGGVRILKDVGAIISDPDGYTVELIPQSV
ncbi:hypothetical protein N7516_003773 [Penicillium verrucosum]|uniref:uncharacterized protein n=1 Tax=Penicillium verrucosum TaxID=60171 RepID=UPI0025455A54|nr:uncharacterized protein N7516_003773 [Penicillium verrucosum]KAJ5943605.1 hypothetical protein N7516_003773 [Penicillium verrucosum]